RSVALMSPPLPACPTTRWPGSWSIHLPESARRLACRSTMSIRRTEWVRLREKGGKRHAMPCHHNLEEYLIAYLDGAELRGDPKGPLFRTIGRATRRICYSAD